MIPLNLWEHQNAIKTLYSRCVEEVCFQHEITRMELDILLFLANNPCIDTATGIMDTRYLSKSQVSSSIKTLEAKGYLCRNFAKNNKKTAHLQICETAHPVIADGRKAQEKFIAAMLRGLTEDERECLKKSFEHIQENIERYLKMPE